MFVNDKFFYVVCVIISIFTFSMGILVGAKIGEMITNQHEYLFNQE